MFSNPWVVGIGTTIIAGLIVGLILYFGFGIGKPDPKKENSAELEIPTASSSVDVPKPKEISEYLRGLPPLQQEEAARNYQGIRVKWAVALRSSFTHPMNKLVYIIAYQPDDSFPSITFPVNISSYPQLKIMKKGQRFVVEGTIASVDVGTIAMSDCRLSFP